MMRIGFAGHCCANALAPTMHNTVNSTARKFIWPPRQTVSVDLGLRSRRPALEEIEVAALVGLRHMLQIQAAEAPVEVRLRGLPRGTALFHLRVVDEQVQLARRHVDLDAVSGAYQRQRTAHEGFRR